MNNSRFTEFKARMSNFGLHFDERIQQRDNNGLLGMYASEFIPSGTILAKFQLSKRIPVSKEIEFAKPSQSVTISCLRIVHSIARELSNPNSTFEHFFEYCGRLSDRKNSVCFYQQADFEIMAKMSPLLANEGMLSYSSFQSITKTIAEADSSLSADSIALATLIYRERCWGQFGFMPGMDLFNHNTEAGLTLVSKTINGEKYAVYTSLENFQPNEEIKITYGAKDIYAFATNYNFFDPSAFNIIDFSSRIYTPIKDDFKARVIKNLEKSYKVSAFFHQGITRIKVEDSGAYFLPNGPNSKMLKLASYLAISNETELKSESADSAAITKYLLTILDTIAHANRVTDYRLEDLPDNLKLFYHVLVYEKEHLTRNRNSITTQN